MSVGRLSPIAGLVQLHPQRCDRFLIATLARELLERSPDGFASGDLRRNFIARRSMVATISGPTLGAVCAATGTLIASHNASSEPTRMQQQRLALQAVIRTPLARGAGE